MSNTEKLVMIPLAPHTQRQRDRDSEKEGEREPKTECDTKTKGENEEAQPQSRTTDLEHKNNERRKQANIKGTRGTECERHSPKALFTCEMVIITNPPPSCPPPPLSITSPLRLFVRWQARVGDLNALVRRVFPCGSPLHCVRTGTFCLGLTLSCEKTL